MTTPDQGGRRGGQRLGRYRIAHRIGEGGSGVVYVGLDESGRAYAIKVLKAHVAGEPDARRRLSREVETLRRVRHPAIAEVVDADIDSPTPYIVTRYVPAPSLHDLVREHGPLEPHELVQLGNGMGQALAAIHAVGVVHRDLKPGNVLVDSGDPVLIDFGIAHILDDTRLTRHGMVMGTPGYLSPELLAGQPVTAASDWWSWAATMVFAASGHPPFGGDRAEIVLDRVRAGRPDLTGVPASLLGVLGRALSPQVSQRPSPAELRVALLDLQRSEPQAHELDDARTRALGVPTADVRVPQPEPEHPVETVILPLDGPAARPGERAATAWTPAVVSLPGVEQEAAAVAWQTPPSGNVVTPTAGTPLPPTVVQPTVSRNDAPPTVVQRTDPPTRVQPMVARTPAPVGAAHAGFAPAPMAPAGLDAGVPPGGPANPPVPQPGGPVTPGQPPAQYPPARTSRSGSLLLGGLALAMIAGTVPTVAFLVWGVVGVLARTVDRTQASLMRRRYDRGPSRSDSFVAAVGSPWRVLTSTIVTAGHLILPTLVGLSVAYLTSVFSTQVLPGSGTQWAGHPLAAGMAALLFASWWGPGGSSLRRGTRTLVRTVSPSHGAVQVFGSFMALVALAAAILLWKNGTDPLLVDWAPLGGPPSTWFN